MNQFLMATDRLIVNGRPVEVGFQIADSFKNGDQLIGLADGTILHIRLEDRNLCFAATEAARTAFSDLSACGNVQIDNFFASFSAALMDPDVRRKLLSANAQDVASAQERRRSTTRLLLTTSMLELMVDALKIWEDFEQNSGKVIDRVSHDGWTVQSEIAPLGVVAFVFEGRPNVFADATGVLRSGNTCVFRIGSDALRTARAMMEYAILPALASAGLPKGAVVLLDAASHSAAWALFSDPNVSFAVARGSGTAVGQLGEVAQQSGIPASLHGTGGAWLLATTSADRVRLAAVIEHSLDRKVCNTLNVIGVQASSARELLPVIVSAIEKAGTKSGTRAIVHVTPEAELLLKDVIVNFALRPMSADELAVEWEWEDAPECSIFLFDELEDGVKQFNAHSPHFVISLVSEDLSEHDFVWRVANAPFVGDGMTRWVDGQFALNKPELGLSNWQNGRQIGRGAILSGDSVHTVRYRVQQFDNDLHR
jgi:glutamate-5-semialdehyde dehydrogenase